MIAIDLQAFSACEKDGMAGLTWDEVDTCNVSPNGLVSICGVNLFSPLLQGKFCSILSIPCPTEEDFAAFDVDGNGIVTMQEYNLVIAAIESMSTK